MSQKCEACACVTPLPKKECVSSCTITSTSVRSPANSAALYQYHGGLMRDRWPTGGEEGKARVLHPAVRERGREHEQIVHAKDVRRDDLLCLRKEPIAA